ncbi:MAG: hypothetical protein ACD_57C00346G0002 [uncultured bacterium]|nr:MAG: hypothetical protein ACD_57C00346G0002 [uncultured bacterium]
MGSLVNQNIVEQIVTNCKDFEDLIEKNWGSVNKKATNEYLAFLMWCATFMLQDNEASKEELDDFHRNFYKRMALEGLLQAGEQLEYEKLSRERYRQFFFELGEGILDSKKLNALMAKEALNIENILQPKNNHKEDILGELYPFLFATFNGLMLGIQLLFVPETG